MIGGGLKMCMDLKKDKMTIFFMAIIILLLKVFAVQITYNKIYPKLVLNSGGNIDNFVSLSFYESLIFVLLIDFLFKM
tara:strand:- start:233 stop:466 length:234 start_codon:yes stop_codon:yes gene_type:complete